MHFGLRTVVWVARNRFQQGTQNRDPFWVRAHRERKTASSKETTQMAGAPSGGHGGLRLHLGLAACGLRAAPTSSLPPSHSAPDAASLALPPPPPSPPLESCRAQTATAMSTAPSTASPRAASAVVGPRHGEVRPPTRRGASAARRARGGHGRWGEAGPRRARSGEPGESGRVTAGAGARRGLAADPGEAAPRRGPAAARALACSTPARLLAACEALRPTGEGAQERARRSGRRRRWLALGEGFGASVGENRIWVKDFFHYSVTYTWNGSGFCVAVVGVSLILGLG